MSQRVEPSEAHIPVWDPASAELASNHIDTKPQVVPVSATATGRSVAMVGTTIARLLLEEHTSVR